MTDQKTKALDALDYLQHDWQQKDGREVFNEQCEEIRKALVEKAWVIWSNEHDAWWRPNRNGYTTLFRDAGHYSYDEAVMICSGANWGCSGDGDKDRDGRARSGQGRPMETMLPAIGCYGKKGNIKHPEQNHD